MIKIKKMNSKKVLIISSIIFYLLNILNIYLSIQFMVNGYLPFFIVFCILFVIDKIVIFLTKYEKYENKDVLAFMILDICQLGFLYYFFFNNQSYTFKGTLMNKLFARIYPTLILQVIYIFGLGILKDTSLDNHIIILSYVNFVL